MKKVAIMYIEQKVGLTGAARIGRVTFSKSGQTIYYQSHSFQKLKRKEFKSNYFDVATSEEYWISGCRKDGEDRLYSERVSVEIDDDVREDYWTTIRGLPENKNKKDAN